MKHVLLTLSVIIFISTSGHSQSMEGVYSNTWESIDGALTYTLSLNPDGSFLFESTRNYKSSIPPKTRIAKGTWERKYRLLKLFTETSAEENDLAKELNENKARLKAYSPRHRKYKVVKPSLKFYRSKVFYTKDMKLIKHDNVKSDDLIK